MARDIRLSIRWFEQGASYAGRSKDRIGPKQTFRSQLKSLAEAERPNEYMNSVFRSGLRSITTLEYTAPHHPEGTGDPS